MEAEKQEPPMGSSQWRNHGVKYGYWKYFTKEVKSKIAKTAHNKAIHKCIDLVDETGDTALSRKLEMLIK